MKKIIFLLMTLILFISTSITTEATQFQLINTIPAAPSNLGQPFMANPAPTSISFGWADNSNNETGFKIEIRGQGQIYWTEIAQVGQNVTSYSSTGLQPDTNYEFRVRAYNSFGNSAYANELDARTSSQMVVLTPKAGNTLNGASTYNITWEIIGEHIGMLGGDIGVLLYYSTDGINYNTINRTIVAAGAGSYNWVVPNINAGHVTISIMYLQSGFPPYYVSGTSEEFKIASITKLSPISPSNLSAKSQSSTQIRLEWDQCASDKIGFKIERKTGFGNYVEIADVAAKDYEYLDTGLSVNTKYYYRVRAYNNFGSSSYSNEATAVTNPLTIISSSIKLAPNAPSNLVASAVSGYQADMMWDIDNSGVAGVKLERKVEGGSYEEIQTLAASISTYSDKEVSPGKTYYYRVKAYNSFGNSGYSNEAEVNMPSLDLMPIIPLLTIELPSIDPITEPSEPTETGPDYDSASNWAIPEIEAAIQYGLTTDKILDNFQQDITREEFCEIVVKLYEVLSGQIAQPISPNPFTDTINPEILKAYRLGIVYGKTSDSFAPENPVTRQEICVMLLRVLKVAQPGQDYSTTGALAFSDENDIASWAIEAVRYMNQAGIMNGTGNNSIDPKGNTRREQAIALIKRTFEKYE